MHLLELPAIHTAQMSHPCIIQLISHFSLTSSRRNSNRPAKTDRITSP
jgi:hypothetical protein